MFRIESDKDELNNKCEILNEEISEYKNKYEMELNKSKLYQMKLLNELILLIKRIEQSLRTIINCNHYVRLFAYIKVFHYIIIIINTCILILAH